MDPIKIIDKYYTPDSKTYKFLINHSNRVAAKAVQIAKKNSHLNLDIDFIWDAAMLHDIGIFLTNALDIGCKGDKSYICHGYLGREILEKEGLYRHALVCETHVGVGLTVSDIEKQNLPIPKRDMTPKSIEEEIICFADKFFSKTEIFLLDEKPLELVRAGIKKFGDDKLSTFDNWIKKFNYKD